MTHLRIFTPTRLFIKMLLEIFVDLAPFFYVLTFAIFTISSSFTILMYVPGSKEDYTNLENYVFAIYLYIFQQFPAAYVPLYKGDISDDFKYTLDETLPSNLPLSNEVRWQ